MSFFIVYAISAHPCQFNLTATFHSQDFTSPGYPNSYPSNLNCKWIIQSESGGQVEIQFVDFATEDEIDYVEVNFVKTWQHQVLPPIIGLKMLK